MADQPFPNRIQSHLVRRRKMTVKGGNKKRAQRKIYVEDLVSIKTAKTYEKGSTAKSKKQIETQN